MRLDAAINQFVGSTIAALQMAGSVAGARVHVDGGQAQAYSAGWDDALVSLARALGVADADELPAPRQATVALPASEEIDPALLGRPLTPRERDVAECVGAGYSTREIAKEFLVGMATVKTQRRAIISKTGAREPDTLAAWLRAHPGAPVSQDMSDRELQVGRLLLQDRTRKEIGVDLHLSPNTVKVYINAIYRRLNIHDLSQLKEHADRFAEVIG